MDTFTPPVAPQISGSQVDETPHIMTAQFGDGYKQTLPDGLNPIVDQLTLNFDPISLDNMNTILTFLRAHVGQPFLYTLPDESSPRVWDSPGPWRRLWHSYDVRGLTITLMERFDAY